MIYLDNAATTFPKPKSVIKAVNDCLLYYSANPGRSGHSLSQKGALTVYKTREQLADYFHFSQPENVIFTPNCTFSLNTIIKGTLDYFDEVLISSMEHNAVLRPLHQLEKEKKIKVKIFETIIGDKEQTFRSFLNSVSDKTKLVICTHVSNVCGAINPIEKIGPYCREKGILFAVDSAQSAGVLNIDIDKMCIDYLAVATHKGLYSPMGIGALIINNKLPNQIIEGGTGTQSLEVIQPDFPPEKYESGTVNLPGVAGVLAGVDFIKQKHAYSYETDLFKRLHSELKNMNFVEIYTPTFDDNFAPVISFNIRGIEGNQVSKELSDKGIATRSGFHCSPLAHSRLGTIDIGTVRVCPSVFTTKSDIDRLIDNINIIRKKAH